ncbi:MAG TPA: PfkB family carbohydrate kinase [Pseudonocardiaceae bacterium]
MGLSTLDLVQVVGRRPGVDEKVVAERSDLAAGGPAAVAGVTFGTLGGQGVLVSGLGPGPVARLAAAELDRVGLEVVDAWVGGADLSISAVTVLSGSGERSVISRNAEGMLVAVPAELPALIRDADVLLIDGHHPALAVPAARVAHAAGVPVVLDCGSPKAVYAELVPLADTVVCSAAFVAGTAGGFEAIVPTLVDEGARLVATTAGAGPVRWRTREAGGAVKVPPVDVRDTVGAGDVLHGAVAFARARGITDPARILRFGVAVASVRVQHAGPRSWLDDQRLPALADRA